jgi:hypothetical protein
LLTVVSELAVQAEVLADPEAHKQVEAAHAQTTILEVALANKSTISSCSNKIS